MSKKLKMEEVQKIVKDICGYTIIDKEYKNSSSKMNCIDSQGYKYYCTLQNLKFAGKSRAFQKSNPHTIENIKLWMKINKRDDILISTQYISNGSKNKDKLVFVCKQGHEFKTTWADYQSGKGCPKCVRRYESLEDYKKVIYKMYGDEYEVLGEYKNSQTKILMRHNICGHEWLVTPNSMTQGHGCPNPQCCYKRGENHYKWNPNLTAEDRLRNSSRLTQLGYKRWRGLVLGRYNNKCVICGTKKSKNNKLIPHHLNSWNSYIDQRLDVNNGVAMCEYHHKEFHSMYGFGNNTKEQFEEYKNNKTIKRVC